MTYLRHYFKYDKLGHEFKVSVQSACNIINSTAEVFREQVINLYLCPIKKRAHFSQPILLPNNKDVALIIECTVASIQRSSGLFQGVKLFYYGKNLQYCVKSEIVMIPDVICEFTIPAIEG
ncbi:hypothetical protein AYI68_g4706 [Smittium mucronatum]|uniref:Transposase Helix-turn-helix domain-containing protein n=1 Tax=Smittium mucronatum TaxID=133383 RepID=A0A1R0GWC3_9FUNG|nr:hypothetical protein AYI68_g4706 [Smittium mucronatum]